MDTLTRLVYRSTLRAAVKLDSRPALQALIHRDVQRKLPEDFNSVLSVFLGGPHRVFFMPSLLPGPTVAQTVRDAFRFPPGTPSIDSGLMGMRFLTGIVQLAEKHGLLAKLRQSSDISLSDHTPQPQVRLQALPEQGCLLVSHPLLYNNHFNFFYQTVVLLCQHSLASGTYGLVLNKLMSSEGRAILDDMSRQLGDSRTAASGAASGAAAGTASRLDLSRDLPAALQALMDHTAQSNEEEAVEIDVIGQKQPLNASSSSSDDDLEFEVSTSDSDADAETIDVTFSTSESSSAEATPPESTDAAIDTAASQLSPTTSYTPVAETAQTDQQQQQQPEQLARGSQPLQHRPRPFVPASEALDQQPVSSQQLLQGEEEQSASDQASAGAQQAPQAGAHQSSWTAEDVTSTPSSSQGQDQLVWRARMKPPPASRGRSESQQSRPTIQDTAGDIADPRHPFRFHQVVSSLRRTVTPVDPVEASTRPQPGSAVTDEHASAGVHAEQGSSPANSAANGHAHPAQGVQPEQEPGSAGVHLAQSASGPLHTSGMHHSNSTAETRHSMADGLQGETKQPLRTSEASQDVGGSGGGSSGEAGSGDALLQQVTVSRGGPVPGAQQLHRNVKLGGDVVQGPTSECPGLYLGIDNTQAKEARAAGRVSAADIRFFLGESNWVSQQLEHEIARGSWLLLSPDPQLLQELVLQPHLFANRPDADEANDEKLRSAVRQGMWQHVLTDAGSAFADLSNVTKALVKDVHNLKY